MLRHDPPNRSLVPRRRIARRWTSGPIKAEEWYNNQVKYTLVSPGYKYNLLVGIKGGRSSRRPRARWGPSGHLTPL